MKKMSGQILLGLSLLVLSIIFYFIHYAIFRDPHHIFLYLIGDIAFVFIEVLLVTLIIHQLLSDREKRVQLEKLNMVIGVFFSEIGTDLLVYLSNADPGLVKIRNNLIVKNNWSEQEFKNVHKNLNKHQYMVEIITINLSDLRSHLIEKRDFLIRLLENPILLEHESFTGLLRAVFHLTEELQYREDIVNLPSSDYKHLTVDINRAYGLLVKQWLDYMKYIKSSYPFLFSLAMRTNPFDKEASVIVRAG
jgi:hypothetical protein